MFFVPGRTSPPFEWCAARSLGRGRDGKYRLEQRRVPPPLGVIVEHRHGRRSELAAPTIESVAHASEEKEAEEHDKTAGKGWCVQARGG